MLFRSISPDVSRLPPLLKSGEIDYAFLYGSTAWAHGIRHIPLDPRVNLGCITQDYSRAEAEFTAMTAGAPRLVRVRGEPVTWTLAVPTSTINPDAVRFVKALLTRAEDPFKPQGIAPLHPPRFYGSRTDWEQHFPWTHYAGALTP